MPKTKLGLVVACFILLVSVAPDDVSPARAQEAAAPSKRSSPSRRPRARRKARQRIWTIPGNNPNYSNRRSATPGGRNNKTAGHAAVRRNRSFIKHGSRLIGFTAIHGSGTATTWLGGHGSSFWLMPKPARGRAVSTTKSSRPLCQRPAAERHTRPTDCRLMRSSSLPMRNRFDSRSIRITGPAHLPRMNVQSQKTLRRSATTPPPRATRRPAVAFSGATARGKTSAVPGRRG